MHPLISQQLDTIRLHQVKRPVETVPIARALGNAVFYANGWPDNISGYIRRSENPDLKFDIFVNKDHHPNRRRFTIAHEIAHAVLHADRIGDGITEDGLLRSGLPDPIEWQANDLAADILMPWHLLTPDLRKTYNIPDLAKMFQVSPTAMSIRLGVPQ